MGLFLLWHGFHVNRQHWLLKHRGQLTMGVLESVTRTRHRVNSIPMGSTYSVEISFHDDAGTVYNIHSDVDDEFCSKYSIVDGTYRHVPVEVAYLADDPDLAGPPEMLGLLIWPFFVGGFWFCLGGLFIWLRLLGIRRLFTDTPLHSLSRSPCL